MLNLLVHHVTCRLLHNKPNAAVRAGAFMRTGPRKEEEEESVGFKKLIPSTNFE
jgi:hypothetical protein